MFSAVERFVEDSFGKQDDPHYIIHLKRTAYWAKRLDPACDEAVLIAAISHDIERAFMAPSDLCEGLKDGFLDPVYLARHQQRSAEIISGFLQLKGASPDLVARVRTLVSKHEEGGSEAQNLLRDADSLSFLENNITHFVAAEGPSVGKGLIKRKFDWMYQRISSPVAREIAKKWYIQALRCLDEEGESI